MKIALKCEIKFIVLNTNLIIGWIQHNHRIIHFCAFITKLCCSTTRHAHKHKSKILSKILNITRKRREEKKMTREKKASDRTNAVCMVVISTCSQDALVSFRYRFPPNSFLVSVFFLLLFFCIYILFALNSSFSSIYFARISNYDVFVLLYCIECISTSLRTTTQMPWQKLSVAESK